MEDIGVLGGNGGAAAVVQRIRAKIDGSGPNGSNAYS